MKRDSLLRGASDHLRLDSESEPPGTYRKSASFNEQ